jgi:SSS family solute:Na+ symporter
MALSAQPWFAGNAYAAWATALVVLAVAAFGALALGLARRERREWRARAGPGVGVGEAGAGEFYFTARGSKGKWLIAWSFYASAVGSWVIAAVPDFAFWGGILGLFWYALAAGLPIVLIGLWGNKVQAMYPKVLSLSDFSRLRFGPCTLTLCVLLTLFNMAVASCAEYTTIASLLSDFVGLGSYDVLVVLLLGVVTLTYATAGGLSVSIMTDRVQGMFTMALFWVVVIYLLATWRVPGGVYQPAAMEAAGEGELKQQLLTGTGTMGTSAVFTMPLSLTMATVFSEAMWQRVWAGESPAAVRFGSMVGALLVFVVVFGIGFTGTLGGWAYGSEMMGVNPNVRLFYVLSPYEQAVNETTGEVIPGYGQSAFTGQINSGVAVLVMVLAVTMSESALDSMQNGIAASLNGAIAPRLSPRHARLVGMLLTVLLNVPMIVVGLLKLPVISLFLVANMVCTSAAFPVVLGLAKLPLLQAYLNDAVPPLAFLLSLASLVGYSASNLPDGALGYPARDFESAVSLAFYGNMYAWDYFAVAFGTSVGWTALLVLASKALGCKREPQQEQDRDDAHDNDADDDHGGLRGKAAAAQPGEPPSADADQAVHKATSMARGDDDHADDHATITTV